MTGSARAEAAAPSYSEGRVDQPSMTLAGALRVTNSGVLSDQAASGFTATASFTPAAAPYGAGDIMDVAKQMLWTDRSGIAIPTAGLLRILDAELKIDIASVPAGQTSYTLHFYSVTPPSAQADNDTWTMVTGDLTSYRGSISLGTPVDLGSCLYVKTGSIDTGIRLTTTGLFGVLVTVGAHTAAAVARQVTLQGVVV